MGHRALTLVVLLLAAAAAGGEIRGTVQIRAADGGVEPTADMPIVVYLTGFRQPPPPDTPVISQKDKNFVPDVQVVVAGQSVQFTNDDPWVHNVFSTSTARPFDLGQPEIRFDELARSMGVPSTRVESAGEVGAAIAEALETDGPYLIDLVLHQEVPGHDEAAADHRPVAGTRAHS